MGTEDFLRIKPQNTTPDFSYLEDLGTRDKYKFATCFDNSNFKQNDLFEARITHIYDPSKFWIVTKFRELECFQKLLFRRYYMDHSVYKIPADKVLLNQYCVVLADGTYFRALTVALPKMLQDIQDIQVFYMDYGMVQTVSTDQIYYMRKECFEVPLFCIRASLEGLCPINGGAWSTEDTMKLCALVKDKVVLVKVLSVNENSQTLGVTLREKCNSSEAVHELLVTEGYALHYNDRKSTVNRGLVHLHLFPVHQTLESGKVPVAVSEANYQEDLATISPILNHYYKTKKGDRCL